MTEAPEQIEAELTPMEYMDKYQKIPPGFELVEPEENPWSKFARTRSIVAKKIGNCGHKIDIVTFPKTKCPECWITYFVANEKMTGQNIGVYREGRKDEITAVHGKKYTRMLGLFIEFIRIQAERKKEQEELTKEETVEELV